MAHVVLVILQIEKFPQKIPIVSGQFTVLRADDFQATSPNLTPSQLIYRIVQPPTNDVRVQLMRDGALAVEADAPSISSNATLHFTQAQLNKGLVRVEHVAISNVDGGKFDAMTMEIGGSELRVLLVEITPLRLALLNHSVIEYTQGKTYVVLNRFLFHIPSSLYLLANTYVCITRSHLGAESNGGSDKVYYNITKPPQNGSLYWVIMKAYYLHPQCTLAIPGGG